jgi:hypothetical protein
MIEKIMQPTSPAISPAIKPAFGESWLQESHRLQLAGALNGFGDVLLLADGIEKRDPWRIAAGSLYTVGAAAITFFGSPDNKQQRSELQQRLNHFLLNEGMTPLPLEQEKAAPLTQILRHHSTNIMLGCYTLGAAALLASGVKPYLSDSAIPTTDKRNIGDILVGGVSLLVKGTSWMMPEQKTPTEPDSSEDKGWMTQIKDKPMQVFGYGSLLTELFWAGKTVETFKNGEQWKLTAATTASYILSDLLIATTHKNATHMGEQLTASEQSDLEEKLAKEIARQSLSNRAALYDKTANFLSNEPLVRGSKEDLRHILEKKSSGSWAERTLSNETETIISSRC